MYDIRHTDTKGKVKYYATYHTAWRAAARLNETAVDGTWLFEGDEIGWFLHFEADTTE